MLNLCELEFTDFAAVVKKKKTRVRDCSIIFLLMNYVSIQ